MNNEISILDMLYAALPQAKRFENLVWELTEQEQDKQLLLKRVNELKSTKPIAAIRIIVVVILLGWILNCIVNEVPMKESILYGAVTLAIGLAVHRYLRISRKEEFAEKNKRYNEYEKSIPVLTEKINTVMNEAIELGYDFTPLDYFTTDAIQFFINAFERYLARDMHEAAVLYEQALMRNEDLQRQDAQHRAVIQELEWLDIHVMMAADRNNKN